MRRHEPQPTVASEATRLHHVKHTLKVDGPLYVKAMIPDYAREDFMTDNYSAWYVGHLDASKLEPEVIQTHFAGFQIKHPGTEQVELLWAFATYLEHRGYVMLHSWTEGIIVLQT
jgi:hypothetical protein